MAAEQQQQRLGDSLLGTPDDASHSDQEPQEVTVLYDDYDVPVVAAPASRQDNDNDNGSSERPTQTQALALPLSFAGVPEIGFVCLGFCSLQLLVKTAYDCEQTNDDDDTDAQGDDNTFNRCRDNLAYAVFAAAWSVLVVVVHLVIKLVPQNGIPRFCASCAGTWREIMEPFLVLALWVLWIVTLPILTMPSHSAKMESQPPYQDLGTGWLMTWLAAGITTCMAASALEQGWNVAQDKCAFLQRIGPPETASAGLLLGVLLISLTVLWCLGDFCDAQEKNCTDEPAWGVAVACVSMLYCFVLLVFGKCGLFDAKFVQWGAVALTIWWWLGATVVTVVTDPWVVFSNGTPANGFLGTWLAFLFSALMALNQFGLVQWNFR